MRQTRPQDWPRRLADYLAAHAATPFAWGSHDCGRFAAGWLLQLGYPDLIADLHWSSPLGAARVIRSAGSYADLLSTRLVPCGCQEIPPLTAARGDLVLLPLDARRQVLAVVAGPRALAVTHTGYTQLPYTEALVAYSV